MSDIESNSEPLIIWLDGTHGVGKSSVAQEIEQRCTQAENLDSDAYWLKRERFLGGGFFPQNNKRFLATFKNVIETKIESGCKVLLVQMALTEKECKELLFEPLREAHKNVFHIILSASYDVLVSRIKGDQNREQHFALDRLDSNISFLSRNYPDAVRINTDSMSIPDIADLILSICGIGNTPAT